MYSWWGCQKYNESWAIIQALYGNQAIQMGDLLQLSLAK